MGSFSLTYSPGRNLTWLEEAEASVNDNGKKNRYLYQVNRNYVTQEL